MMYRNFEHGPDFGRAPLDPLCAPNERRGRRGGGRGHGRGHHHGGGPFGDFTGRVRRGDMRALLLAGLLDGPAHGYELMQRLEERTGGRWRPSPGSVYPMLQQLEDEALATQSEQDGRKVYSLTDAGREEADPNIVEQIMGDGGDDVAAIKALMGELKPLHLAARQIAMSRDTALNERAAKIVRDARQKLYGLLAE